MAKVQGTTDPAFAAVRDTFQAQLDSGNEVGASLCVTIAGETVVDLWGGYTDANKTKPWNEDTIVPVWSSTKTLAALAVLLLADRGQIDLYAPASKYWPELAGEGRDEIQVRHFLSHSAGLPSWDPPLAKGEEYDVAGVTAKLIKQKPWWTPGTASGYHLQSQGYLIGELVRKVTGKTLGEFVHEEFCDPLNADFYLPLPEKHWSRVGEMIPPDPISLPEGIPKDSIMIRAFKGQSTAAGESNTPNFRQVGVGSYAGFANAKGMNRVLSLISNGGSVNGRQFLSPAMVDKIFETQTDGTDLVLGIPIRFGMGFGLPGPGGVGWMPQGKICFWGGYGGSICIMDVDRKMTITYAMCKMGNGTLGNDRTEAYALAVFEAMKGYGEAKL